MVVLPAFALKKRAPRTPVPRRFRWRRLESGRPPLMPSLTRTVSELIGARPWAAPRPHLPLAYPCLPTIG